MTRTWLAILSVCCAFMGWTLLSLFLLQYGNDWWLSGLVTLTVLVWLAGLLVALFQQGRVRAAATGAVIASAAYWLLALGPWFGTTVGPALLTSRGLTQLDFLLHGPPQQTQAVVWQSYPPTQQVYNISSGVATPGGLPINTSLGFTNTTMVPSGNGLLPTFGHWSLIWLCAGVGGCAAFLMHWRVEKRPSHAEPVVRNGTPSSTTQSGESPFAPPPGAAP